MDKLKDKKGGATKSPTKPDTSTKISTKPDTSTKSSTKPDTSTKTPTKDDATTKNPTEGNASTKSPTKDDTSTKSTTKDDTSTKSTTMDDTSTKNQNKTEASTKSQNKADASTENSNKADSSKNSSSKENAKTNAASSTKAVTRKRISAPESEPSTKQKTSNDKIGTSQKDKSIAREEESKETESSQKKDNVSDVGAETSKTKDKSSDAEISNCAVNNDSGKDEDDTVSKDNSQKEETETVNEKNDKDDANKKSKTVNEKKGKDNTNKTSKEDDNKDKSEKSKENNDTQTEEKSDNQERESETQQNEHKENESSLEKETTLVSQDDSSSSEKDTTTGSQEESSSGGIENVQKDKTDDGAEDHESMEVEESTGESETKKSDSEMESISNIEKDSADKNIEESVTESDSMETDPIEDTEKDPINEETNSNDLETSAQEESRMETDDNEKDKADDGTEKEPETDKEASAIPKKEGGTVEDDEIMEVPVVKKPAPIVDLVDDDEEAKNKNDKSCGPSSKEDSQTNDNSDDGLCNNVLESHMGDIVENAGDIIGADDMLGLRISSVVGGEDCITGIAMDDEDCHEHDAIEDIQIESVMTLQQPSSPQDPSAMEQEDEAEKDEVTEKIGEGEKTQEDKESDKEKDASETDKDKNIENAEKDEAAKDGSEKEKDKDEERDKSEEKDTAEEKDKTIEKDKSEEKDKSVETISSKEGEEDKTAEADRGEKNSDDGGGGLKIVSMTTLADKEQEKDKETDAAKESSETAVESTTDTTTSTAAPKIRLSSAVSAVATESDVYFLLRSAVMMPNSCESCKKESMCRFRITKRGEADVQGYLCTQDCKTKWCSELPPNKSVGKARLIFEKCCGMCGREMNAQSLADQYAWETRDFCSSKCVDEHLVSVASNCHQCEKTVDRPFVGKYCVRFGSDIHQFCANSCLDKYKTNIKVCCYCQKNLASSEATKIVSKTSNKEYCSEKCLKRNQRRDIGQQNYSEKQKCTVCENSKINKYEFMLNGGMTQLCSDPCLNIYKYANKVKAVPCCLCQRLMNAEDVAHFIFQEGRLLRIMCTDSCLNTYILSARKIKVCASCKVKKYNFDMVSKHREEGKEDQYFCSLNCLDLGEGRSSTNNTSSNGTDTSNNNVNSSNQTNNSSTATEDEPKNCNMCQRIAKAQYHMVMSDNTLRNFCSYDCATKYKGTYGYMVSGASKSVTSSTCTTTTAGKASDPSKNNLSSAEQMKTIQELQSLLNPPVMVNKMTWCRPQQVTKGVYCKPHPWHKSTQTDPEDDKPPPIIPVPLPIYVPTPMMMYNAPMPVPIFIPLPIPVPIFIPMTAKTTQGIKETLEQLKDELPDDPFEAEMLLLAKRTAEEAEESTPKEDTETNNATQGKTANVSISSGFNVSSNNSGANALPHQETNDQDAISALSHLESCLEASIDDNGEDEMDETDVASLNLLEEELPRFHFRDGSGKRQRGGSGGRGRKRRRVGSEDEDPDDPDYGHDNQQDDMYEDTEYYEKDQEQYEGPFLNSNYGLAAWKHWVQRKNSELSRLSSASRPMKLFKEDLLSLNCDELNNALCIFLKDIRKPSGEEFQGDTVFYLLLGIQQYLFACSRTDCIFMDFGFERFTTGLDDICKRFLEEMAADSLAGNFTIDGTRITEDMLWESRQLGAHTPQVLLNTLFYFNTKVFRLKTVEEHVAISFVQIVKQWKRANVGREGQVQRMTLLRYFPKKSANTGKPPDWQGYYMYENKEDPLRCPVKLYEFYLSKCPESVRNTRNIYYVYPERSCVPDSPVWFSTQPLHPETLSKMLNRALMVREVQESHSQP